MVVRIHGKNGIEIVPATDTPHSPVELSNPKTAAFEDWISPLIPPARRVQESLDLEAALDALKDEHQRILAQIERLEQK